MQFTVYSLQVETEAGSGFCSSVKKKRHILSALISYRASVTFNWQKFVTASETFNNHAIRNPTIAEWTGSQTTSNLCRVKCQGVSIRIDIFVQVITAGLM